MFPSHAGSSICQAISRQYTAFQATRGGTTLVVQMLCCKQSSKVFESFFLLSEKMRSDILACSGAKRCHMYRPVMILTVVAPTLLHPPSLASYCIALSVNAAAGPAVRKDANDIVRLQRCRCRVLRLTHNPIGSWLQCPKFVV